MLPVLSRPGLVLLSVVSGMAAPAVPPPDEPPIVMAPVRVQGEQPLPFTVETRRAANGTFRLILKPVPPRPDYLCIMVGGARTGDEILAIDGKDVGLAWRNELFGDFVLLLKRRRGLKNWEYLEVTGRRGSSSDR